MFDIFSTLMSKTFFILALSLCFCYFGAQAVIAYFRRLKNAGSQFVTAIYNEKGQEDLIVHPSLITKPYWISLISFIVLFILLSICRNIPILNMILMTGFTFTSGITLGLVLITRDENLGIQVTQLTALAVFLTGIIATKSGIDFGFLGGFLFIGLILLIIGSIVRIFVRINGTARKIYASFGIFIFCGYLLYDFNRLVKLDNLEAFNTWNHALMCAVDIYLDIINLFMQILDLLSNN